MRQAFAHDAVVRLDAGDLRAIGAAVTAALCGACDHAPPCPLAPHYTSAADTGDEARIRVLFACEPSAESGVRDTIVAALRAGELDGPDGVRTRWTLGAASPSVVRDDETAHAARLIGS